MRWPEKRLALYSSVCRVHLKDRKVHTAQIVFRPPILAVFLDDSTASRSSSPAWTYPLWWTAKAAAWVGFTASTGAGYENHDILNWSFDGAKVSSSAAAVSSDITYLMWSCLPNRNLCTPERATVEPKGAVYHVVLPANQEWGASIPNPSGRTLVVTNSHGIICWDTNSGVNGCSGPSGNGTAAGAGFLDPGAPTGALILSTREGRTWFSVNHRVNTSFKDNRRILRIRRRVEVRWGSAVRCDLRKLFPRHPLRLLQPRLPPLARLALGLADHERPAAVILG